MIIANFRDLTKIDSQIQEIRSRNILIDKLLYNNLEIAIPVRDLGIDLIIYSKLDSKLFKRVQLKSSLSEHFSFSKNYLKLKDVLFVYIMNLSLSNEVKFQIYGMNCEQVLDFLKTEKINYNKKGWAFKKCVKKTTLENLKRYDITENTKFRDFFLKS